MKNSRFFGARSSSKLVNSNFEVEYAPKKRNFLYMIFLVSLRTAFWPFFQKFACCRAENFVKLVFLRWFQRARKNNLVDLRKTHLKF